MHNPVKLAAAALSAAMLFGCSGSGVKVNQAEKAYETGMSEAKAEIPQFECTKNREFAEIMNEEYENMILALLDEFMERTQKQTQKCEFDLENSVKLNNGRIVSVVCEGEAYTGGAHAEKFRMCRTMDFDEGKTLTISDVFSDDAWKQAADVKMLALAQSGEERYRDLWQQPETKDLNPENFYLKDDAVVVYFPPYELSYYRKGFVEFELKYKEFSGYMNEDIKTALGMRQGT